VAETERIAAEIGHVLFVDMVAYSLSSFEEQRRLVSELRDVVRGTPEFLRTESRHVLGQPTEIIANDTGDGMSLVFFRDPLSPVQCASEIARAVRTHGRLKIRMGIHSGPVSRVLDINGKETVSGSGINIASRVMNCGDEGHILLSSHYAGVLREFETWANCLRDLGEVEVKHNVPLAIYNLVMNEVGNPILPRSVTEQHQERSSPATLLKPSTPASGEVSRPTPVNHAGNVMKVVLLYKRGDALCEPLLKCLEDLLLSRGFEVFIDRHLRLGEEWAREILSRIRAADAVVPLLSATSISSEMMAWEIEEADKAAREQNNRPRLLPIRVNYNGPLPDPLAAILDHLQYTLWKTAADDERIQNELLTALVGPTKNSPTTVKRGPVGGAVPLDSEFYVERPTDIDFRDAIDRQDSIVLVKGGRQMGKTSLLARGLQQARQNDAKVVFIDFQALSVKHLQSAEALYLAFAESIADQLDLDVLPDEIWNVKRGPNVNLERYLRREVLGAFDAPLVWGLDEVDRLFTCPFGSEVFGLFRSWHNRRSLDPTGPWSRLTLAIAYATEAHLFITDLNQSPFNVGTRLALSDFTEKEAADLNRRYDYPLKTEGEANRFFALIGGQPYLTNRGLDFMASQGADVGEFEMQAISEEGLYGDHLRRMLFSLSQDAELVEAVRSALRGTSLPTPESFYRLRAAGVFIGDSPHSPKIRCRLYADYLGRHLL